MKKIQVIPAFLAALFSASLFATETPAVAPTDVPVAVEQPAEEPGIIDRIGSSIKGGYESAKEAVKSTFTSDDEAAPADEQGAAEEVPEAKS